LNLVAILKILLNNILHVRQAHKVVRRESSDQVWWFQNLIKWYTLPA